MTFHNTLCALFLTLSIHVITNNIISKQRIVSPPSTQGNSSLVNDGGSKQKITMIRHVDLTSVQQAKALERIEISQNANATSKNNVPIRASAQIRHNSLHGNNKLNAKNHKSIKPKALGRKAQDLPPTYTSPPSVPPSPPAGGGAPAPPPSPSVPTVPPVPTLPPTAPTVPSAPITTPAVTIGPPTVPPIPATTLPYPGFTGNPVTSPTAGWPPQTTLPVASITAAQTTIMPGTTILTPTNSYITTEASASIMSTTQTGIGSTTPVVMPTSPSITENASPSTPQPLTTFTPPQVSDTSVSQITVSSPVSTFSSMNPGTSTSITQLPTVISTQPGNTLTASTIIMSNATTKIPQASPQTSKAPIVTQPPAPTLSTINAASTVQPPLKQTPIVPVKQPPVAPVKPPPPVPAKPNPPAYGNQYPQEPAYPSKPNPATAPTNPNPISECPEEVESLGCFARPSQMQLSLVANMQGSKTLEELFCSCGSMVEQRGLSLFVLSNQQCFSLAPDADYDVGGPSNSCVNGSGRRCSNSDTYCQGKGNSMMVFSILPNRVNQAGG